MHRIFAAALTLVLFSACSNKAPESTASPAATASEGVSAAASASVQPATAAGGLSAAEVQYGVAPTRNANVTYQPDVVIPDGGANAVRSVSSDGLTWTIDANTPHADELAVGKIFFITGRGVGRILATTKTGDSLALTLGPVEITDVIQEAHLSGQNITLDPSTMYSYTADDYPGASVDMNKVAIVKPTITFASYDEMSPESQLLAVGSMGGAGNGAPPSTDINGYHFNAFCCGGLGVQVAHKGSDIQVLARAVIRLSRPSVDYALDIHGGKIQKAVVILHGTAGLELHFEASTPPGMIGNVNKQFYVPVDLSFPIGGLAVPLALTVHQQFILKTAFGAKNSTLAATGAFTFGGDLTMGYQNGGWGVSAPGNYAETSPDAAVNSITGVSLATSAVEVAYEGRVIVGIGAFGFVTGPYVGMNAAYGVTRESDTVQGLAGAPCVAGSLRTALVGGVGYSMPQTVTKAINVILHALNVAPIQGFGGLSTSKEIKKFHTSRPSGCA